MRLKSKLLRLLLTTASVIAGILVTASMTAGPASASPTDQSPGVFAAAPGYSLKNVQTGRCLDDSISQGLRANTCTPGYYQQWQRTIANGWQNMQTGRCLDDSISQGLRVVSCNGGTYQSWSTSSWSDIWNAATGRCLDDSISQGIRTVTCNGGTYQKWNIIDT